jgi:hypothetical protein
MNAYHPRVVLMPISHASTPKALTNAYAIRDMLWMDPITAVLVCNKTVISS